jgi:hypothetical protein
MKKAILGLAVLTVVIIAGCSKDDDGGGTREQTIRGKWTPVSTKVYMIDRTQNTSKTTYSPVYPGDYSDFRSDGKLYTYTTEPNAGAGYDPHDTLSYRFTTQYLIIEKDSLLVGALTKDSLVLYLQENTPTQSWETTYTFKK